MFLYRKLSQSLRNLSNSLIEEFLIACNIQPNDYSISSGNWSGKFDSWNITFNKDVDYFGKTLSSGKAYGITSAIDVATLAAGEPSGVEDMIIGFNNQVIGAYKSWSSSSRSNATNNAGDEMMEAGVIMVAAAGVRCASTPVQPGPSPCHGSMSI